MSKRKEIIGRIKTPDGTERDVIGETWKFWVCKDCQWRKSQVVFTKAEVKLEKPKDEEETEKKGEGEE